MRLLFSWPLLPPKLICWSARLHGRVTERVQQVRLLSRTSIPSALVPFGQHFLKISLCALQGLYVRCDALKLFLGQLVNAATGSASSITSFQDFGQLCQSKSDPKRSLYHQHSLQGARGIEPVARLCPRGPRENADSFIVSDRVWTHTSRLGQVSGTKSFGTAVLHHAKYQPWNAFQSQDVFEKSDHSREALYVLDRKSVV